jgi:tetratricopeptide (TPR) repeat protein
VYAEIRSNPLRIGELLVRTGRITPADLEQARAAQVREQGSRRLGQVLVAMGALGQRELQRVVEQQVGETVFELLSWQEGHFSFTEEPLTGVPADVMVRIRTETVLMEGARRIDEWSRIETHVRHLGVVPVLAPADDGGAAQLDLLPAEWEVLAMVDGARSVREIAADLGRSEFDVARVLFGLASTGIVSLLDPGAERRPARASAGGDAAALLATAEARLAAGESAGAREAAEAAIAMAPGEVRAHVVLARAHLEQGRTAEAIEEGRRAVRLDPLHLDAHRWFGVALATAGRFAEAVEQFTMWERLAAGSEPPDRELVASARAAAETFVRLLGGSRG